MKRRTPRPRFQRGLAFVEVLFATALLAVLAGATIPVIRGLTRPPQSPADLSPARNAADLVTELLDQDARDRLAADWKPVHEVVDLNPYDFERDGAPIDADVRKIVPTAANATVIEIRAGGSAVFRVVLVKGGEEPGK